MFSGKMFSFNSFTFLMVSKGKVAVFIILNLIQHGDKFISGVGICTYVSFTGFPFCCEVDVFTRCQ